MHARASATPVDRGSNLVHRFTDAVARRARHWWRQATQYSEPTAAESAWRRLLACATDDGLAPTCGTSAACPGLTAATIPTLWSYGAPELALRWGRKLIAWQKRDGALPDAGLLHPSVFNTAQAVKTWSILSAAGALPEAREPLVRASRWLVGRIDDDGALRMPTCGGSFDRWAPASVHLAGLAVAHEGLPSPAAGPAIRRAIEYVLRTEDPCLPHVPTHAATHGLEALWELRGLDPRAGEAARRGLESLERRQRPDGGLPVDLEHSWISAAGSAHAAALWFRAGKLEPAARAVERLRAEQRPDGAWCGSWGRGAAFFPHALSLWAVKYFLDAALDEVAASFAEPDPTLLAPPADDDRRLTALVALAAALPDDGTLIDVGCGSGRYLAPLAARFPRLSLAGVDPSAALLRHVPAGVAAAEANLLHLPLAAARYDGAVCIEALEHALVPSRAVDELCRIVKPGGRVLIIDKAARFQNLSHVRPWERWFAPETVSAWLAEHCDAVTCTPLEAGPQQRTPGLFLAWHGVRRAPAVTVLSSAAVERPARRRAA